NPALIRAFWESPGEVRAPGGESWNELCARVHAATDRLATLYPQGNVIVVAHFGAILAALQRAGGLTPTQVFAHKIDNLSVTEITLSGADWHVGRINHLP
ncbi:MAG: histidine phosphatase family protein, partial [Paracoccaceae bacterium]|nr:histidine phosphatase family protein [Paracoccaceae bacterium]